MSDEPQRITQARYDAGLLLLNWPNVPPILARDPQALAAARAYLDTHD